jgi:hypothetical protein
MRRGADDATSAGLPADRGLAPAPAELPAEPTSATDRTLVPGGVTDAASDAEREVRQPFRLPVQGAREMTAVEVAAMQERLHRFVAGLASVIQANAGSSDPRKLVQLTAARAGTAEALAALDCIERGQAFVWSEPDGTLRDTSDWIYRRERLPQADGMQDVVVAIDLARFPEILPMRAELEHVRRGKNDDLCAAWNALALEVRQRIVRDGEDARRFMSRIQAEMLPLLSDPDASRVPDSRARLQAWHRAAAAAARVPVGGLGPDLEAIPGVTSFNGYTVTGVR